MFLWSSLCLQSHRCLDADCATAVTGIATSVTGVVGASTSFGVTKIMGTTIKAARGTMAAGLTAPAARFLWLWAALWLGARVVCALLLPGFLGL